MNFASPFGKTPENIPQIIGLTKQTRLDRIVLEIEKSNLPPKTGDGFIYITQRQKALLFGELLKEDLLLKDRMSNDAFEAVKISLKEFEDYLRESNIRVEAPQKEEVQNDHASSAKKVVRPFVVEPYTPTGKDFASGEPRPNPKDRED